ncbi:hypothetical protein D3C77_488200 [compost metagenome]
MMNGRDTVSAMNPLAITNGNTILLSNFSALTMERTIGVIMSAAPSFANSADTAAPSKITKINIRMPFPLARRATCSADHSNNPISSKIKDIKMSATKVSVAFQIIPVTTPTSVSVTTPKRSAKIAPTVADHPILNPFGCQITKVRVHKNISTAIVVIVPPEDTCK